MNIDEALAILLESQGSDCPSNSDDNDSGSDHVLTSSSVSEGSDGTIVFDDQTNLISKDGNYRYTRDPPMRSGRPIAQNCVTIQKGIPNQVQSRIFSPLSSLKQFISKDIVETVIKSTNHFVETKTPYAYRLNECDFWSYLACLYFLGIMKSKNSSAKDMWDKEKGIPYLSSCKILHLYLLSSVLSYYKFSLIGRNIRFDKRVTRPSAKDSAISVVWSSFISNCTKNYKPSAYLTVDEQLCNTRGRCSFKSYIPSKPGKYGIKIWCICDAENAYFLNGQIYTGKIGKSTEVNQGERVVRDLSKNYLNAGRNITTDNFFTTMQLSKYLFVKKTTLIGTVRKTRKFLPKEICGNSRAVGSEFIFHDNKHAIVRFTEKPGKTVTLLSSHNPTEDIEENGKPAIVNLYNQTKAGVDTLDQLVRFYTVKRKTRRWPLVIFFNILDIACYNAYVLYSLKYQEFREMYGNKSRRQFISDLVDEIKEELSNQSIDVSPSTKRTKYVHTKHARCTICPRSRDSKPNTGCDNCFKTLCKSHLFNICEDCRKNN